MLDCVVHDVLPDALVVVTADGTERRLPLDATADLCTVYPGLPVRLTLDEGRVIRADERVPDETQAPQVLPDFESRVSFVAPLRARGDEGLRVGDGETARIVDLSLLEPTLSARLADSSVVPDGAILRIEGDEVGMVVVAIDIDVLPAFPVVVTAPLPPDAPRVSLRGTLVRILETFPLQLMLDVEGRRWHVTPVVGGITAFDLVPGARVAVEGVIGGADVLLATSVVVEG